MISSIYSVARFIHRLSARKHGGVATFDAHLKAISRKHGLPLIPLSTFSHCISYLKVRHRLPSYHIAVLSAAAVIICPLLPAANQVVFMHGSRGLRRSIKWSIPTITLAFAYYFVIKPRNIRVASNSMLTSAVNFLSFGLKSIPVGLPFDPGIRSMLTHYIGDITNVETSSAKGFLLIYCGVANPDKNIPGILNVVNKLSLEGYNCLVSPITPLKSLPYFYAYFENILPAEQIHNKIKRGYIPCLVNPCVYEPFGYVFLEALSCGIPAIYSNGAGIDFYSRLLPGLIQFNFLRTDYHFSSDNISESPTLAKMITEASLYCSGQARRNAFNMYYNTILSNIKYIINA